MELDLKSDCNFIEVLSFVHNIFPRSNLNILLILFFSFIYKYQNKKKIQERKILGIKDQSLNNQHKN